VSPRKAGARIRLIGDGVYRVGGGVTPPRVIYGPDPEYSEQARQAKVSGTCVLRVVVDPTGLPRDVTIEKPLGMGLDEKAIAAVRTWRFTPAMKDGVPVAVQVNIEVSFRISYDLDTKHQKLSEKADAGDTKAQFETSQDFLSGRGVPHDESRDSPTSRKRPSRACPRLSLRWQSILRLAEMIW